MMFKGTKALGTAALVAAVFLPAQAFAVAGPGSLKKQAEMMEAMEKDKAKAAGTPAPAPAGTPAPTPTPTPTPTPAPTPTPSPTPAPPPGPRSEAPLLLAQADTIDPAAAERGKQNYKAYCQKCHGLNMVTTAAGFFDLRKLKPDEKPRFVNSVTNGLRAMPAWGSIIKPAEIEDLWAYVITTNTKK